MSSKKLPVEFQDLPALSPDLRDCLLSLRTESPWRNFGIYQGIVRRSELALFLTQSRVELRKFIEDESGNALDPLTCQRIENFWTTLISVQTGQNPVRIPVPLFAIAGLLLLATLSTGVWYLLTRRSDVSNVPPIPVAVTETASAPVIPKKNVNLDELAGQMNILNAQYSDLSSSLAGIPEAKESLDQDETAEAAAREMKDLQKEWDGKFQKFVEKLKEIHSEISVNPEDSFPSGLQDFQAMPFTLETRSRALEMGSNFLNQLSVMISTPEVNLEDSENDSLTP